MTKDTPRACRLRSTAAAFFILSKLRSRSQEGPHGERLPYSPCVLDPSPSIRSTLLLVQPGATHGINYMPLLEVSMGPCSPNSSCRSVPANQNCPHTVRPTDAQANCRHRCHRMGGQNPLNAHHCTRPSFASAFSKPCDCKWSKKDPCHCQIFRRCFRQGTSQGSIPLN